MSQDQVPPGDSPFRRATRADAVALARQAFAQGQRVDMGVLAGELGIGRATLYRWLGSREELLGELLEGAADELLSAARRDARGAREDRVVDFVGRMMAGAMGSEPVRVFVRDEPELALRLLLTRDGRVQRCLVRRLREVIAEEFTPREAKALERFAETVVQVGTAHQWAVFSVGEEPSAEPMVDIARALLAARRKK